MLRSVSVSRTLIRHVLTSTDIELHNLFIYLFIYVVPIVLTGVSFTLMGLILTATPVVKESL